MKKSLRFADETDDLDVISEDDALRDSDSGSNLGLSSSRLGSSKVESTASPTENVAAELEKLAGKDNRNVRIWKSLVMAIIAIAGVLVSIGIYFYLKSEEDKEFEESFDLFTNTIEDISRIQFRALLDATATLSTAVTAQAMALNLTFPFVTLNNFEVFARDARMASKSELFTLSWRVQAQQIADFNAYAPPKAQEWIAASRALNSEETDQQPMELMPFIYDTSYNINTGEQSVTPTVDTEAEVLWQTSPVTQNGFMLMTNLLGLATGNTTLPSPFKAVRTTKETTFAMATVENAQWVELTNGSDDHERLHQELQAFARANDAHDEKGHGNGDHHDHEDQVLNDPTVNRFQPHGMLISPVWDSFDHHKRQSVGSLIALFSLDAFLLNLLPSGVNGMYLVVKTTCGDDFTYRIDGSHATYLGVGDLSDPDFHHLKREISFEDFLENPELHKSTPGACLYSYQVTPSFIFEDTFRSDTPVVFAFIIGVIFAIMAITFFMYDTFVSRRNAKIWGAAVRSTAIVSSLFPSQVRDRIYANPSADAVDAAGSSSAKLRRFVDKSGMAMDGYMEDSSDVVILESKPIADLFPETTVMFCDIAGFTAWSSVREPSQVFTLLETLYRAFDRIAKQRHVFKVETVGDCYVAVAGCPDPMKNHAVVMSRFALECLTTMDTLTKRLEMTLGPDTGDLAARIGLHSGPVTAGVLRGERARFQLFGDTMNTAARMESTGERSRIQVSEETADLLIAAGKKHWLLQRADIVYAKGKGALKTFWLVDEKNSSETRSNNCVGLANETTGDARPIHTEGKAYNAEQQTLDSKTERLINWNVDVMYRLLKKVVARRISHKQAHLRVSRTAEEALESHSGSVLSEVKEIISLPVFDAAAHKLEPDSETVQLEEAVKKELEDFVASIASMYRFNPFHSFEHASHVTMSVVKLLSRIVAPIDEVDGDNIASSMHDHTYGITSDPLTQFSCVLSALIHDADHPGVPNAQLVQEQNHLATFYRNQSVAEQNSVDLAWNLLMDNNFKNLRGAIYGTEDELRRFRQLVVNSVMATDIVDKELKALRNARWEKAFSEAADKDDNERDAINRKATIVIEHLIQASDVAHTMQHWHIYRKWNERFFLECYSAYKAGRAEMNPADGWYKGELGFFDFYIIPLAKKLKECGVFGVASDEYLNYAQKNRQEWEIRGAEIVASMVEKVSEDDKHDS